MGAATAGGNVYNQAASGLTAAGQTAGSVAGYNPMMVQPGAALPTGYRPVGVGVGGQGVAQLSGANLNPYMNPYTQSVIDTTMGSMNRARQMTQNTNGAQATAAGAFGGSRHGLVEAQTNGEFGRAAGEMAAGLNQANFGQAQNAAISDVAATNAMRQFNAGLNLQGQMANQQAGLNAAQMNLGAGQFNAGQQMQAGLANQAAGLSGAGLNLQGAGMMGNLANLGFGMGQQVQGQQAQQGAQQQGLMQGLIDAAKGQWGGYTGSPQQSVGTMLAPVSGVPHGQTQSTSQTPGMFNWMSMLLGGL